MPILSRIKGEEDEFSGMWTASCLALSREKYGDNEFRRVGLRLVSSKEIFKTE